VGVGRITACVQRMQIAGQCRDRVARDAVEAEDAQADVAVEVEPDRPDVTEVDVAITDAGALLRAVVSDSMTASVTVSSVSVVRVGWPDETPWWPNAVRRSPIIFVAAPKSLSASVVCRSVFLSPLLELVLAFEPDESEDRMV
jgi:hypothetical protein